ncbi:uncharacterized protein LOC104438358 [Eucalyptus grandis]|uniref:uncharacterized protein LOC104438358 n=1 Tax=Eucalyptus grandis TaxID=71139 RepID=UPI00192F041D|nr:uncharacterized protein LOC104438358 [Eucalyptus grandis]
MSTTKLMAEKHLHELLREDQEPFHLKNHVSDRRKNCLLKSPKKRRPISQNSNFGHSFCKNPCFFASSADPTKSPLFDPRTRGPTDKNAIFLHVPAKTAALLLEAALRIHNHTESESESKSKSKSKNNFKNNLASAKPPGVGIFSSLLRRLSKQRKIRGQAGEEAADHGSKLSVKDILRQRRSFRTSKEDDGAFTGTLSAEKQVAFVAKSRADAESPRRFDNLSSSESDSPRPVMFRKSPPSGRRTPEFRSPPASPRLHDHPKDKDDHEAMSLKKFEAREAVAEAGEEEEKEQCSPVSVLDRPFEDDDDDEHTTEDYYDGDEDYVFDYESSYALVQRTKQQLLQKLYRFERLAELDPVELEKRMLEQISDEEDGPQEVMSEDRDDDFEPMNIIEKGSAKRSLIRPNLCVLRNVRVPSEMRRLIINEDEQGKQVYVVGSWKGVDFSTIDTMVDQDFVRDEADGLWKRSNNKDQVGDTTAVEIELAIFGSLVQELTEELSCGLGIKF